MKATLPVLYGLGSQGKVKQWEITAFADRYEITFGVEGGKLQTKARPIKGKNIGRSNETDAATQSLKEATARWDKQQDKGYRLTIEELGDLPVRAMKLQSYRTDKKDNRHKVKYPAAVQPKLNGIKAVVTKVDEDTIEYESRGGKKFTTLSHLTPELLTLLAVGQRVDGEVYIHGTPLQDISSAVKKVNDLTPKLEYWIYDVVDLDTPFGDRGEFLLRYAFDEGHFPKTVMVEPMLVHNEEDYNELHEQAIQLGYEGTVIRNMDGMYKSDYRSYDALKRKDFEDAEFEIVGYTTDVYNRVVWVCKTEQGLEFSCVPRGTDEERNQWLLNGDSFVGKRLTVRYLELSTDLIPTGNCVGICVRDYE